MRPLIIIILVAFLFACKEDELHIQDDKNISTINGTWKVITYTELDTEKVITKDSSNSWGYDVVITFNDKVEPSEVSGRVTTNSVNGEFIYLDNRSIRLPVLGTTYANQPEWGNKFTALVLENDLRFEVNKTQLRIYNDQKKLSALLEKE
ncbi:MAG: hypothetical protein ACQETL_07370 [Bacteroidota bacterium]